MIPTTFSGESVYLLNDLPSWSAGFKLAPSIPSDEERSLGGIRATRPTGQTLRCSFEFELQPYRDESSELRVGLQRLKNKRILCPLWPAMVNASSGVSVYVDDEGNILTDDEGNSYTTDGVTPWVTSGIWLTFYPDWSAWEIHTNPSAAGTFSADALKVPLLLGVFSKQPQPQAITPDLLACNIQFREDSPAAYSLRPLVFTFAEGPTVEGRNPPIFPISPNWSRSVKAGEVEIDFEREQIGYGRELAETYYAQDARRALEMGFTSFDWEEIASLLCFFLKRQGCAESFWLHGPLTECELDAPTSSEVISVKDASLIGDNRYISISEGSTSVIRRILEVDEDANTFTLDSAPGSFSTEARITSLILARFKSESITIAFETTTAADSSIQFIEEPTEYYNPTGETYGATHGALPCVAWLYRFTRKTPTATIIDRFTSFERDVNAAGEAYAAKQIESDGIEDAIDPDDTSVSLKSRDFDGNPLALFSPNALEIPLMCEVLRCYPDTNGIAVSTDVRFTGEVKEPHVEGPIITAKISHTANVMGLSVPVPEIQPECNLDFCSVPCGLLAANWTFTATVVSVSDNAVTLSTFARSAGGSVPTFGTNWFAYGRVWYDAPTFAERTIYSSTAISYGQITLSLSHGFVEPPVVGSTVTLMPGCNGSQAWCKQRYENFPRFGGFPYVPTGNPSLVPVTKKTNSNTGKK